MKAIDFMVGDWVNVTAAENIVKPDILSIIPKAGKVVGIDGDCIYVDFVEHPFMFGDIEPIPMTPEILEKNGFRHGCYVGGYYSPDCPFRVFTKTEGTCGFTTLFDDEIHFSCIFVHQLQHALRLCGIEKEIIL